MNNTPGVLEENSVALENRGPRSSAQVLPRLSKKFLIACLILAFVKLWMISGDEIVVRDAPFDDPWYILSAAQWYWKGAFNQSAFMRTPGYPLWIATANLTGIPLRIATELLLLSAAFAFVVSLAKAGQPQLLCILLYTSVIFHPLTFYVNNYIDVDTFYAPVLLFALAGMILLLLKRYDPNRLWLALITGLALAILWYTRQENILIAGYLVIYGLIVLFTIHRRGKTWLATFKRSAIVIIVPAIVILIVSLIIRTINYTAFGVFADTEMSAPSFEAANKALMRIKEEKPIRFVTVPREARKYAYAISQAFRELEPYLEGEYGQFWMKPARDMGIQDEIVGGFAGGWFNWAFRGAATLAGHHNSAPEAEAYYQKIANETNAACDDGRLRCEFVLSALLDPHILNDLPYFPSSLPRIMRLFVLSDEIPKEKGNSGEVRPYIADAYNILANRRIALSNEVIDISGWAFHLKDPIQKIVFRNPHGKIVTSVDQFSPRPDVADYFTAKDVIPRDIGYHFRTYLTSSEDLGGDIVFITKRGTEFVVPYKNIILGKRSELLSKTSKEPLRYTFETSLTSAVFYRLQSSLQTLIWSFYGHAVIVLTYVGLGALLILLIFYRSLNLRKPVYAIIALLLMVIAGRVALFTLIDASLWPADQPRYLYPVTYLYTCLLLITIFHVIQILVARITFKRVMQRFRVTSSFTHR